MPFHYWTPSGHGTFRLGFGRSWSIAADYRRAVTVLQGVTVESFNTDAVVVETEGALSRRLDLSVSVAYSNGRTGAGDSASRFASYGGLSQLRYAIARCCAATVNYDYYYYSLQDVAGVPSGVPPQYDRNSVLVGFTLWLPLYGSYASSPDGGSPGRD
jgi:hypothetical protein